MGNRMTDLHKVEIANVLADYPDAQTEGFPAAQRNLWLEMGGDEEEIPRSDFRPDAYLIDHVAKEVVLFEVEITSFMTERKCAQLGYYWFEWDAEDAHDWLPVLITVDRHGARTRHDLCDFYYRYTLPRSVAA